MRIPDDNKYEKDALSAVAATPWSLFEAKPSEVIFKDRVDDPTFQELQQKMYIARRVYLQESDFDAYGMTRGCPKCDHKLKFGSWGSRPHSNACRRRIEAELANSPSGQARLKSASTRLDLSVGDVGQRMVDAQPQEENNDEVVVQSRPAVETPPSFIEMPSSSVSAPVFRERESGVVLPPTDEAGQAETHRSSEEHER